jgi:hypothetical protein
MTHRISTPAACAVQRSTEVRPVAYLMAARRATLRLASAFVVITQALTDPQLPDLGDVRAIQARRLARPW